MTTNVDQETDAELDAEVLALRLRAGQMMRASQEEGKRLADYISKK